MNSFSNLIFIRNRVPSDLTSLKIKPLLTKFKINIFLTIKTDYDFQYSLITEDQAVDSVIFRCMAFLNRMRKEFVSQHGHLLRQGKPMVHRAVWNKVISPTKKSVELLQRSKWYIVQSLLDYVKPLLTTDDFSSNN